MEVLKRIAETAEERGLSFLVVVGHALNAWGVSRQTCDLDLMVPENELEKWKEMLGELGYLSPCEHEGFLQYGPPARGAWPLDLLVVNLSTFAKLRQASASTTLKGVSCRVPSVDHLLAMKFHALKFVHGVTALKYLQDVHSLLARTSRAVTDDDVRELCLGHGNQEVYERLVSTSA
jgi:hypothetical protein